MAHVETRLVGDQSGSAPRPLRARKNRRRVIRVIAFGSGRKSEARPKGSRLKRFRGRGTTEIFRLHRSSLLRRRSASCSGGTGATFAAVSSVEKSLGTMTRLLRNHTGCVRTRRGRADILRLLLPWFCIFVFAAAAEAQVQVDLKFKRLQYIAHESVVATVAVTNLAGRDIELHDANGQSWLGFEITGSEEQPIPPLSGANREPALGIPDGAGASGEVRTYSLMTNRFPDHTSLYVRVQDQDTGVVYATYSLGRTISFEQPQAEIDRSNQLHVLHCAAPRAWSYARIGLNGELLTHSSFMETKTRPHLVHSGGGEIAVHGGMVEAPAQSSGNKAPKLSARPPGPPTNDDR